MSPRPRILRIRVALQVLALLAAIALCLPGAGLPWQTVSPYVTLAAVLALRSAGVLTLVALPLLVLIYFRRRWFCRHLCPVGFLGDSLRRLFPRRALLGSRAPHIGQWIALLTLAGAVLGYPLLLWLDPLAIFSAFFGSWQRPATFAAVVGGLALPLVLLTGLLFSNLWCCRLCPLGATQDLLARYRPGQRPAPARRIFLFSALGLAGAWAVRRAAGSNPPCLRPPGAAAADQFAGLCLRCGNCIRVCPSRILQPDLAPTVGFMTPVVNFATDYCRENCNRCNQSCPSGAITRLGLPEKNHQRIGLARLDLDACQLANGQDCTACIHACPYHALSIVSAADGFGAAPHLDPSRCNGCGACQSVCPVRPTRAIVVRPRG